MINKGFSKYGLRLLDTLTDIFPTIVPRLFQRAFLTLAGNRFAHQMVHQSFAKKLAKVRRFEKLLVIVDVNIGDAVIMQSTVHALHAQFPDAKIDYVCNFTGGELVRGMNGVRTIYNIFTKFGSPSLDDMNELREVITRESYDVIFNLCGFINPQDLHSSGPVINLYVPWASEIARRWIGGRGKIHLTIMVDTILTSLVNEAQRMNGIVEPREEYEPIAPRPPILRGSSVYLRHVAIHEAQMFLVSRGLIGLHPLIMLHADAPFQWTQIPITLQSCILENVLQAGYSAGVLLSCGNARSNIGSAVLRGIPEVLRGRVIMVPPMSIAAHAALIDACDVFVSGDTGNMHIAAARKIPLDAADTLHNTTAVVGIFGATDSRMSGYDSLLPEHLPGEQDAPAKVFVAAAPCRNISCINKPGKSCADVRCFFGLDGRAIAAYINTILLSRQRPKSLFLDTARNP